MESDGLCLQSSERDNKRGVVREKQREEKDAMRQKENVRHKERKIK